MATIKVGFGDYRILQYGQGASGLGNEIARLRRKTEKSQAPVAREIGAILEAFEAQILAAMAAAGASNGGDWVTIECPDLAPIEGAIEMDKKHSVPTFRCAGRGCQNRARPQGSLCARCTHDA